jgi:hypothetical protein
MRDSLLVTEERREGIINWGTWIGQGAPKYNLGYNLQPSSPELGVMLINTSDYTLNWPAVFP